MCLVSMVCKCEHGDTCSVCGGGGGGGGDGPSLVVYIEPSNPSNSPIPSVDIELLLEEV